MSRERLTPGQSPKVPLERADNSPMAIRLDPDARKEIKKAADIVGIPPTTFIGRVAAESARRLRDRVGGKQMVAELKERMDAAAAAELADTKAFLERYLREHPPEENPSYLTQIAQQVARDLYPAGPQAPRPAIETETVEKLADSTYGEQETPEQPVEGNDELRQIARQVAVDLFLNNSREQSHPDEALDPEPEFGPQGTISTQETQKAPPQPPHRRRTK